MILEEEWVGKEVKIATKKLRIYDRWCDKQKSRRTSHLQQTQKEIKLQNLLIEKNDFKNIYLNKKLNLIELS